MLALMLERRLTLARRRARLALIVLLLAGCEANRSTPAPRATLAGETGERSTSADREAVPAPDFVTNALVTSGDEEVSIGFRVAIYDDPTRARRPREQDRSADFAAGLLFGARAVRDSSGAAIGLERNAGGSSVVPANEGLLAWVFDARGHFVSASSLEAALPLTAGSLALVITAEEAARWHVGPGWTIAIEP